MEAPVCLLKDMPGLFLHFTGNTFALDYAEASVLSDISDRWNTITYNNRYPSIIFLRRLKSNDPMKYLISIITIVVINVFIISDAQASDISFSLPALRGQAEQNGQGTFFDTVRAMAAHYPGGTIKISGVYPFARSMQNIIDGRDDVHIVFIVNPNIPADKLDFMFSSETLFYANFIIYSRLDLNINDLSGLRVATDAGHVDYFPEISNIIKTYSVESALKMVESDRIDAYIFAMPNTDPILKELGYSDIKRKLYRKFPVKMVLQKNASGKEVDDILTPIIQQMRASGELEKTLKVKYLETFTEW